MPAFCERLFGLDLAAAKGRIIESHYSHAIPSGKSTYYRFGGALIVYSIPANNNLAKFVLGRPGSVWELTRMWAPDGHERNLLTRAMSESLSMFREDEPGVEALVSFADPNVGHEGHVYRAASWVYTGRSSESRYYIDSSGQVVARRKFHSGDRCLKKSEIEALGYRELKLPGKHRFVKGITRRAKKDIRARWSAPKEGSV